MGLIKEMTGMMCCLLLTVNATAQQYAIGIRHGTSFWLTKNSIGIGSLKTPPGQHFTYDKEAYLRLDMPGKWDYEAGIAHYSFSIDRQALINDNMVAVQQTTDIVDTKVEIQYDVTYPLLGYIFPVLSKMRSHVGFATEPRVLFNKTEIKETGEKMYQRKFSLLLAFNYMHTVPISKRWSLTSVLSFSAVPFDKYSRDKGDFYNPNRRIAWHTGIQYHL